MPAVHHLLNPRCVQEMKSYRVLLSKRSVGEGSCPSQTRKMTVAHRASKQAKLALTCPQRTGIDFKGAHLPCPPLPSHGAASSGKWGRKRKSRLFLVYCVLLPGLGLTLALKGLSWWFWPLGTVLATTD